LSIWNKIFSSSHPGEVHEHGIRYRLERFQEIVRRNNRVLERIADASEKLGGEYIFDVQYLHDFVDRLGDDVRAIALALNELTGNRYQELLRIVSSINDNLRAVLESRTVAPESEIVLRLDRIGTEHADVTGSKMARLGEIQRILGLTTMPGVVVTASACTQFLESAGLEPLITAMRNTNGEELFELAGELRNQIIHADVQKWLQKKLRRSVRAISKRFHTQYLSVRSSAIGEDEDLVFAGQYLTELGVRPEEICDAYRKVVASLYDRHVMEYRIRHSLPPADGLMAVGIQVLLQPKCSGIIYTLDPTNPDRDVILVSSGFSLGASVVDGSAPVDRFIIDRNPPHHILESHIAEKTTECVINESGGTIVREIEPERRKIPTLEPGQLQNLCRQALKIERHMRCAQDIEWAMDEKGRIFILQSRQLKVTHIEQNNLNIMGPISHEVLLKDLGEVACRGVGFGRVWIADNREENAEDNEMPDHAVLVSRTASPKLAALLPRASALLTDYGTTTGHLATVAREYRIPAVVDTGAASRILEDGRMVTVDTEENMVYSGKVQELIKKQLLQASSYEDKKEFRMLRRLLRNIAILNLSDPTSPDFKAQNCRTYHDIIRFAHEIAVQELATGNWLRSNRRCNAVFRLDIDIPIDLVIIDLGGGIKATPRKTVVTSQHILSRPLTALLAGMTLEGVWKTEPADMDLGGFMSSATRTTALTGPEAARPEQNVAIVSNDYLNMSLKLGYHFNLVDCLMSDNAEDNFIYFRFAGGVTELLRRSRRALLLREILEHYDFVVEGKGDLVIARLKFLDLTRMQKKLEMIGRLIGFTRQLDIHLRSDDLVRHYIQEFLAGSEMPSSS